MQVVSAASPVRAKTASRYLGGSYRVLALPAQGVGASS